jgi:hypothetical protein
MIRQDRLQLNERFIRVFQLLEERGVIVKNDRSGKGMGDFAEKILGNRAYGHIVRAYLNPDDKRCIDYSQARILCREYGINESYLIDGIGNPFGFDLPANQLVSDTNFPHKRGNIIFTSDEAFANRSAVGVEGTRAEEEYFNIPGLSGGGLYAFPINGNSMEPVIQNGDIVICREVHSINEVKDNKIYAVKTYDKLVVKYVQKITDSKGRVTHLNLISSNHLEHDPFKEPMNEYIRFYQVIRRISDL